MRNLLIIKRCGCELKVVKRVERNVLKWLGHVERRIRKAYRENMESNWGRGRRQRKWRGEVRRFLMWTRWVRGGERERFCLGTGRLGVGWCTDLNNLLWYLSNYVRGSHHPLWRGMVKWYSKKNVCSSVSDTHTYDWVYARVKRLYRRMYVWMYSNPILYTSN